MHMVFDRFEWDAGLGAEVFQAQDLDEYVLAAEVAELPANEETIIQALRSFAEMNDGRYPFSLAWTNVFSEINKLHTRKRVQEVDLLSAIFYWEAEDFDWESYVPLLSGMTLTCTAYGNLVKEDKDVAYYGHRITSEDADLPLMRWLVSEDEYRVIYGDLRVDTLNRLQLESLEARIKED